MQQSPPCPFLYIRSPEYSTIFYPGGGRNKKKSRCASSLAVHAISKAVEVSADSIHSRWRCRRGGAGTFASTVSMMVAVGRSTIYSNVTGLETWVKSEMTARSRHCASDISTRRSNGRPSGVVLAPVGRTQSDQRGEPPCTIRCCGF